MPSASLVVVDDEKDIADTLKMGLEKAGFDVDAFYSPLDALQKFQPGRYGMALLDIRMPGMDGFTLYERMREVDPKLKVLFLTGFDVGYDFTFRQKFPELMERCFMKKPQPISTVVKLVRQELGIVAS